MTLTYWTLFTNHNFFYVNFSLEYAIGNVIRFYSKTEFLGVTSNSMHACTSDGTMSYLRNLFKGQLQRFQTLIVKI